jgi:hypothetical protein
LKNSRNEYPDILPLSIIVFTEKKNNTLNRLKTSDRVFIWPLPLEEYGVTFDYLPGNKNAILDALSYLDIDGLKIQEGEVLILLSGSENSSTINIKLTIPMNDALIFKEQRKAKDT